MSQIKKKNRHARELQIFKVKIDSKEFVNSPCHYHGSPGV